MYKIEKFLTLIISFVATEARVLCWDPHASPWQPLGYSCPVRCENILAAIERMKLDEYQDMLATENQVEDSMAYDGNYRKQLAADDEKMFRKKFINENKKAPFKFDKYQRQVTRNHTRGENEPSLSDALVDYEKVLRDKHVLRELRVTLVKQNALRDGNCSAIFDTVSTEPMQKQKLTKCTRRADITDDLIKIVTRILNKYVHRQNTFSEEMTAILLRKLLGPELKLRQGTVDVEKTLRYLKRAVERHRARPRRSHTLTLKSFHCLNIRVPGCYCNEGFAENSGKCVRPFDCSNDEANMEYLSRIIIL